MSLVKQIQFKGFDPQGQIFCQAIHVGGMQKTAEAIASRSRLHPRVQDFVRSVRPSAKGIYILVNALGAGEYWGSNVNGDLFPEKALIHSPPNWDKILEDPEQARKIGKAWDFGFPTFMGAYPYKHHSNKDPSRAFGKVEIPTWNPSMHRVELVVYLDRALCAQFDATDVLERIENGEFPDVSMGCKVPFDVCTICGNPSKTRDDYCECARTMMNKILPDGRKVAVRNDKPKFFDISFVFIGADKTAKVMAKLASKGNQVCMGDFCTVPRMSAELGEIFSKTADPVDEIEVNSGITKELAQDNKERELRNKVLLKTASLKRRATSGLVSGTVGAGAGYIGNSAIDSDTNTKNKDLVKDSIAGALLGVAFPFTKKANDPIKEKIEILGVPVWIEWKKGQKREYKDKNKVIKYSRIMDADYGYIPGTMDADGEELDVYVGPSRKSKNAWVVKQLKRDGSFDEHKVMLGYSSKQEAKNSYIHHMGGTPERLGGIQEIPISSLKALFGENSKVKEASSCSCDCKGLNSSCLGEFDKLASYFLNGNEKAASHAKLSEIIKTIPAGPFTKETLPKLENSEKSIPSEILDLMGNIPLEKAISTPSMAGMVLKPKEFQRIILIHIGERKLADKLDSENKTFESSKDVDDSLPIQENQIDNNLMDILCHSGMCKDRSFAAPHLSLRSMASKMKTHTKEASVSSEPIMKKIAALYNGYRKSLLLKAASISSHMTINPQLRSELFGSSLAKAFAGGVEKVSSASVLSSESLAYLMGAFTTRDFAVPFISDVAQSLADYGAMGEIA